MKYRAVIFDLSGTLVDNWRTAEYEEILSNMAGILCAPTDDFVQLWRESFQERIVGRIATVEENVSQVFKKLKVSIQGHQVSAAAKLLLDVQRHALTPRPDAVRILDGLSDELTGAAHGAPPRGGSRGVGGGGAAVSCAVRRLQPGGCVPVLGLRGGPPGPEAALLSPLLTAGEAHPEALLQLPGGAVTDRGHTSTVPNGGGRPEGHPRSEIPRRARGGPYSRPASRPVPCPGGS